MQIELFVSNNSAFPTVNRTCESTGRPAHTVQRTARVYVFCSLFLSREFTNNNGPLSLAAKEKRDSSLAAAALKLAKKK